jgi:YesN/AraC family two-component response regulator
MRLDYDIPKLKKEKQVLKQELDSKRQILIFTLCAILLLCAFVIHYYKEHRKLNKRFQHFKAETAKMVDFKVFKVKTQPLKISDAIINNILQQLEVFEKGKLFTDSDVKLHSLAKICNTNATYLSQVINLYKKMNVSTYLKNLRITNAIETIKTDRKYLKYSIEGLAKEFGFITAESFSKAFEEKTGHKTSKFLNSLRQKGTNNP